MLTVSIFSISPPNSVQAKPVTTPTLFSASTSPYLYFLIPKKSLMFFGFTFTFISSLLTTFLTTFLVILDISLSKFLTPDSLCKIL